MSVVLAVVATLVVVLLLLNLSYGGKEIQKEVAHLYGARDPQFARSMGTLLGPSLLAGNRVRALCKERRDLSRHARGHPRGSADHHLQDVHLLVG